MKDWSSTTASSDTLTSLSNSRSRNPVKSAAKVVAGAFITCFTPPEDDDHNFKKPLKQTPVSSGTTEKTSGPSSSDNSTLDREKITGTATSDNATLDRDPRSTMFTMTQIYKATRNFSPSLKLGQGGFATVYRGTLDDGTVVAVKRSKRIDYGQQLGAEFYCEIRALAKVEHLNLVRFYGFLVEGDERILVVEYVPNGNLREHLDGIRGDGLDMTARLDIAIDVAHAITYLHMYTECPIIHRDIKSSNILLTEKLRAKVADFGFARLVGENDSGQTHVSTQVKGTAGYLDPEYLKTYQLTEKSDVYSFGVLLIELVTGRRPIETKRLSKERITPKWAITKFMEGKAASTMDPRLELTSANCAALEKVLELAFICLAPQRETRPAMKRCAETLWSIRKDYKELLLSDYCSLSPTRSHRRHSTQEY